MLTDHAGAAELQMEEYLRCALRIKADGRRRVLDWGCGFGHLAQELYAHGMDVTLYDYDPEVGAPRSVQLNQYPHLRATISSDEVCLPFPDGEFDAVVSMGTLEHVQYPTRSLDEIRRVIRPGGYLYVYKLPNRSSYVELLAKKRGRYYHGALPYDRVYSLRSGKQLISSAGFAVVSARYMNMLPLMSVSRVLPEKYAPAAGVLNRSLSSVPGLNVLATNVEIVAVRTDA